MEFEPIHFIGEPIEVQFETTPLLEKKPTLPDRFSWHGENYNIVEKLGEWVDYKRKGRMSRNMQPAHATTAERRGSWGVGRFYFRVRVEGGRIFELYYDRAPRDAARRKGAWFLYRELGQVNEVPDLNSPM